MRTRDNLPASIQQHQGWNPTRVWVDAIALGQVCVPCLLRSTNEISDIDHDYMKVPPQEGCNSRVPKPFRQHRTVDTPICTEIEQYRLAVFLGISEGGCDIFARIGWRVILDSGGTGRSELRLALDA
jgi:hypothetical protein